MIPNLYNSTIKLLPTTPLDCLWISCLDLYIASFPVDERREVNEFTLMPTEPFYNLYSIVQNKVFKGLIELWKFPGFTFIEHLSIIKEDRGMGIGKHVLELIKQKFAQPVILEVEPPVDELSQRRIEFYKRSGFITADIDYSQPPYYPGKNQVPMLLLSNVKLTIDELEDLVVNISKRVYFKH